MTSLDIVWKKIFENLFNPNGIKQWGVCISISWLLYCNGMNVKSLEHCLDFLNDLFFIHIKFIMF